MVTTQAGSALYIDDTPVIFPGWDEDDRATMGADGHPFAAVFAHLEEMGSRVRFCDFYVGPYPLTGEVLERSLALFEEHLRPYSPENIAATQAKTN